MSVADWAVDRGDAVLVTLGLGSCVALAVHDAGSGIGGLAHLLLPSASLSADRTHLAAGSCFAASAGVLAR